MTSHRDFLWSVFLQSTLRRSCITQVQYQRKLNTRRRWMRRGIVSKARGKSETGHHRSRAPVGTHDLTTAVPCTESGQGCPGFVQSSLEMSARARRGAQGSMSKSLRLRHRHSASDAAHDGSVQAAGKWVDSRRCRCSSIRCGQERGARPQPSLTSAASAAPALSCGPFGVARPPASQPGRARRAGPGSRRFRGRR